MNLISYSTTSSFELNVNFDMSKTNCKRHVIYLFYMLGLYDIFSVISAEIQETTFKDFTSCLQIEIVFYSTLPSQKPSLFFVS